MSQFPPPSNRPVDWGRLLPEVRLTEAVGMAAGPTVLFAATLGVLLIAGGDDLLRDWTGRVPARPLPVDTPVPLLTDAQPALIAPLAAPLGAVGGLLNPRDWGEAGAAWLRLLWALTVWSVLGLYVCRRAAVRFATGGGGPPRSAVAFALRKSPAALFAALLPAVTLVLAWAAFSLFGWVGEIPAVGPPVVGLLWGGVLLAALAAVALLTVAVVAWPLQLAALAAEGTDAFDAISRSYSYLFGRPWRLVLIALFALPLGAVGVTVAGWAAASAEGIAVRWAADGRVVEPGDVRPDLPDTAGEEFGEHAAAVWTRLWRSLVGGYAAAYFFAAATVAYFLLRYADDAVPTDEVWLEGDGRKYAEPGEIPRVGVAASDLPVIERPHTPLG